MRNTFADTFYGLGKKNKKLAIVVADISPAGSISKFREDFPERFINTGVAEQIMIGLCAGMALRGFVPLLTQLQRSRFIEHLNLLGMIFVIKTYQ